MQTILRTRLISLLDTPRHSVWQLMFTGCALVWSIIIIGVMSLN